MTSTKRKETLINLLYFLGILGIVVLVVRFALPWLLPFIIGFAIAALLHPLSEQITRLTKVPYKACFVVLSILIYAILLGFLMIGGLKSIQALQGVFGKLPQMYSEQILPAIGNARAWLEGLICDIAPQYADSTDKIIATLVENTSTMVTSWSGKAVEFAGKIVAGIPGVLLGLFFSVISSIMIGLDYPRFTRVIFKQLPEKGRQMLSASKELLIGSLGKMFKGYFWLMLITFCVLSIGFLLLKIKNPFTKALLIAFLDFLPLIGLSVILIPWIILCLLQKKFVLALGLAILYFVMMIARNFLEPRIIGKQIGLNPIVSLICFYVGLKTLGFIGIFLLPLLVIVLKHLNDSGLIHLWKS